MITVVSHPALDCRRIHVRFTPRFPRRRRRGCGRPRAPRLAEAMPGDHGAPTAPSSLPRPFAGRPVIISAANGYNRDPERQARHPGRVGSAGRSGADPLDAAIAGVQIVELDPNDQSVGLGGLPNEEGVVQLDASCMHGPTKRAGLGRRLEDIATRGRRGEGGDGPHRSHHARRRRGEEVRAGDGIQGAESPHRGQPQRVAALEGEAQLRATTGSTRSIHRTQTRPAPRRPRRRPTTTSTHGRATCTTTRAACRTPTARST